MRGITGRGSQIPGEFWIIPVTEFTGKPLFHLVSIWYCSSFSSKPLTLTSFQAPTLNYGTELWLKLHNQATTTMSQPKFCNNVLCHNKKFSLPIKENVKKPNSESEWRFLALPWLLAKWMGNRKETYRVKSLATLVIVLAAKTDRIQEDTSNKLS